ncbi:hypothetical protein BSL78_24289 [Apostichopus japonicus]|uniref:Reverse transcriptase domain-containing protein n=1 Tax=Stichopus japonicus TaxID=307972 RepID=A0A2G8JSY2_STIJA|nr:hypothetical protein BSL78_24289 [Apostichopus japonicus]
MGLEFRGAFLVVRDPVGTPMEGRKQQVPGVLGSNTFSSLRGMLRDQLGSGYMSKLASDSQKLTWAHVLGMYEETRVCDANHKIGKVRISGEKVILVPARTVCKVDCTVKPAEGSHTYEALVEHTEAHVLPNGLRLIDGFVNVTNSGIITVQLCNFGLQDSYLQPRTPIADLLTGHVEVMAGLEEDSRLMVTLEEACVSITKDIEVGSELDAEEHEAVGKLLEKYSNVVSKGDNDIGHCSVVTHRIPLTDDTPIKVPHRRLPPQQWKEVRDHINTLLSQGIIRESSSPYASPVVVVRKKDGGMRLCVDYRALNNKTRKDAYPLPRIEEALDAIGGAKYFCTLDLAHGYHQVQMHESDVEKTAFRSGTGGLYEYLRMPFGLCNAPATFMRLMDHVFGDENFQSLLIYLDDILIFGTTFQETLDRLEMVLQRLQKFNLKVKPSKCQLFMKK